MNHYDAAAPRFETITIIRGSSKILLNKADISSVVVKEIPHSNVAAVITMNTGKSYPITKEEWENIEYVLRKRR